MRPLFALFVRTLRQATRALSTFLPRVRFSQIMFISAIILLGRNTHTLLLRRAAEG